MGAEESKSDNSGLPPTVELDLGKGMRAVVKWTRMTEEQEKRFIEELSIIAKALSEQKTDEQL